MGIRIVGRGGDERGSYIIIWGLLLVAMLMMVAIVVDLGQLRSVRRTNKSITDFASLAAGPNLAVLNPRDACKDALKNIRANSGRPELATISQAAIDSTCGNPLVPLGPGLTQSCPTPLPLTSPFVSLVKAPYTIRIFYPLLAADIIDTRLSGGAGVSDGTACQRMRIEVSETARSTFAKVIGVKQQTSTISSVVRGFADPKVEKVAALLVLERTGCEVLWTAGQGNVLVKAAGPSDPGILHADSVGTTGCSGGPSTSYVVYGDGTGIPSGPRAGQPSIQVEGAATSPPTPCPGGGVNRGFLNMVFPFSATAAAVVDTGVCPKPTGGGITGRAFHDKRYNPVGNPLRTKTVDSLRSDATALLTAQSIPTPLSLADTLRGKGYVVFPDDYGAISPLTPLAIAPPTPAPNCGTNTPYTITNLKVFINCNPLDAKNLTFTGTHFVTNGRLNIGEVLRFPNATEIVVRGCTSGTCTGNSAANTGINNNGGVFTVNDGDPGAAVCVDPTGVIPDRTGTGVTPAHVVVMKGRFTSNGANTVVRMCQTFLYMADGTSPQSTTAGHSSCASVPCPLSNDFTGYIDTQGRDVDWSAPNQSATLPAADSAPGPYEDLAFWSEAGGTTLSGFDNNSTIGGNSTTATSGVFFLPNGLFTFSGNTDISQDFNAQFVSRRLNLKGQGTLTMRPNPFDAVATPFPSWSLIR